MTETVSNDLARFTPQAVEAMNRAYNEVCDVLTAWDAGHAARIKAGETIMFLARNGEIDERKLCNEALREAVGAKDAGRSRLRPAYGI